VALYSKGRNRWAMTERGARRVQNQAHSFSIGPSQLEWTGRSLKIGIEEICSPIPRRIQGTVELFPLGLCAESFALDANGLHQWRPIAPCARVEVKLAQPHLSWSGSGYLDSNSGGEPIEAAFDRWHWQRSIDANGCHILYDVEPRTGDARNLALAVQANGDIRHFEAPPVAPLPATGWRIARSTRADDSHSPRVLETLEDAPFYSRSLLETRMLGSTRPAIHESLSLTRFRQAWVQCLLPFRMPRRA
jgi:carotenoid 1,2-hydratase